MARFKSSHPEHQIYEDAVDLYLLADGPAGGEIATGTGVREVEVPGDCQAILAHAAVAPALAVGDTFDLYVQTLFTCSGVEVWVDVIHFTQILGNGLDVDLFDKIAISLDQAHFEIGTALAADAQRNLIGEKWRCRWVIAGASPAFPFTLSIQPM